jgi:hypothetical protein
MGLIVGLQDRVDDFMRAFTYDDDGKWHFKTRDMTVPLVVTEDQVNQAEETFRTRFKIATAASWTIILGGGAWVYMQVLVNGRYWTMLAILPALYLSFVGYFWANMSTTRALRRRLLDLNVSTLRKATGPKPPWAKLPPRKVIVQQLGLCWVIFAFFSGLSAWMYRNNVRALHGRAVAATVIEPSSKQQCQVAYEYMWKGQRYKDRLVSCPVLNAHPVGSELLVRVDPERPGHSIEPNQSPWPPEAAIPMLLGPLLIVVTVAL